MRGGKLDTRAVLLRATNGARDALNRAAITWPAVYPAFAVQQLQQRPIEAWKAGQSAAQLETAFRCRWNPTTGAISPRDRVLVGSRLVDGEEVGGRMFEVIGTAEPQRREEIVITCVSLTNPEG